MEFRQPRFSCTISVRLGFAAQHFQWKGLFVSIEMIECPHCRTRVVPVTDGACPACRKNTQQEPASVSEPDTGATRAAAWDRYQQSLRAASFEPAIASFSHVEQQFAVLRTSAVARLTANAGGDTAVADRIVEELLPRAATALAELQQKGELDDQKGRGASRLMEYVKVREESWRLLAEAIRENAPEKLQRHIELWKDSTMLMVRIRRAKQAVGAATPVQRMSDFQQALVTFTPRLIATPVLVAANILVFAAMIATGVHFLAPTAQSIMDWGANFGPKTMNGQWWRLVTCMFLHFGILHLGFNMWVLWDIGRLVERLVGNVGFIVLYFVSGIAGSFASLAWHPTVISAGASGAVFGVVGALLGFVVFRRDTVPAAVLKQLRNSMAAFLIYNILYGMTASGIDMAAHLGGLVAGFVCGLILSQPLSVEMIARRRIRNRAVVLAGAIALPLAAFALPSAPPDVGREVQLFAEMEKHAMHTSTALADKAQRGLINDADVAERLERDVLPPWIESRGRIEKLLDAPYGNRAYLSRLVKYMRCREESWQMEVQGLREQNPATLKQASDRWTAADKMARELAAP
jgi:rhomboid protease GluP